MTASGSHEAGTRSAALPNCTRPKCPGKMLDHICIVCGCSDQPGLAWPAKWLRELPTQQLQLRGNLIDEEAADPPEPPAPRVSEPRPREPSPSQPLASEPPSGEPPPRRTSREPLPRKLGIGRVEVPTAPYRDPLAAIMRNPMVAEEARFCAGCYQPVGRGDGVRPGSAQGRCTVCGMAFSFIPRLRRGEVVGARYEVCGCLSHGGQGWIHLAKDHRNKSAWVVLKGVIHTDDPEAAMAAKSEHRFLTEVQHPNIVRTHDFVWHEQAATNYLVMEYLGGPTLRDVAVHHYHTHGTTLPVSHVIAYGLEILRAFAYLHSIGLLYCDLKPSNVLQVRDVVKLIDVGGMRRQNDFTSPLIHTAGFAAPELAERGATIASDVYSVGRTLQAMAARIDDPESELPSGLAMSPFDRVIEWATHPDPDQRPRSADELADHLRKALG